MKVHIITQLRLQNETNLYIYDRMKRLLPLHPTTIPFVFHEDGAGENVSFSLQNTSDNDLVTQSKLIRSEFGIEESDLLIVLLCTDKVADQISHWSIANNVGVVAFNYYGLPFIYETSEPLFILEFEIISLVIRLLTGMVYDNCYHDEPVGCFNDRANNRQEYLQKLLASDICPECEKHIAECNLGAEVIENLTLKIRTYNFPARTIFSYYRNSSPHPMEIDSKGNIWIPDLIEDPLPFTPLFKTIYIFYLNHPEGVELFDLHLYEAELSSIYSSVYKKHDSSKVDKSIKDLTKKSEQSFRGNKSKLNKILTDLLGEELAPFYRIEGGRGDKFTINLPRHLLKSSL